MIVSTVISARIPKLTAEHRKWLDQLHKQVLPECLLLDPYSQKKLRIFS